jgi:methylamine dehydrogenase accessory protein MauD
LEGWWAASYVVLWLLVVVLALVVVALARQIGTLHMRIGPQGALEIDTEGPPLGEPAESFELVDVEGASVAVAGPGRAQLLLFVSPGCQICAQVLPSVDAVASAAEMAPVVLADGDRYEALSSYSSRSWSAPLVPATHVAESYEIPGTPYAVILDELGVVRSKGTINNLEQMEGLVDTAHKRLEDSRRERQAADV